MPNTVWSITFGDYEFAVDRTTLRYRLVETQTGTVWADDLPVGDIVLEERETGALSHQDFAAAQLVSLSEKASAQGKRILFGLDLRGIPVDVYFTCAQREIQLTVEASRDTRTHRVQEVRLLSGLCSIPDDGASYLVAPLGAGALIRPDNMLAAEPPALPIWDADAGLTMPFVGAVRGENSARSALALLTDSAYGAARLRRMENGDGSATLDWRYERDPERRRLDIRIALMPGGDHISIARAYREKIVGERQHVTLRKKMRAKPALNDLLGALIVRNRADSAWEDVQQALRRLGIERVVPMDRMRAIHGPLQDQGSDSRWDDMDRRLEQLRRNDETGEITVAENCGDWATLAADVWWGAGGGTLPHPLRLRRLPLLSAVHHDAAITPVPIGANPNRPSGFFDALLALTIPLVDVYSAEQLDPRSDQGAFMARTTAVLCPLHRLTFPAFLTEHRFLTPDFAVEEAVYSDKTRVVINNSDVNGFENESVALPPLGFFVAHAQMTAHDALRVGSETFATRAWRVARATDDKPLAESGAVVRQEFPA